ncbi:MAG: NUDIX domain-containing protein [Ferruginibacter sp.]
MQIKIFTGEKPIYLTDHISAHLLDLSKQDDIILYDEDNSPGALSVIASLSEDNKASVIISGKNIDTLKESFFSAFEIIEAAGGIVQNEGKEILFILRKGKWDLPKGKTEEGENLEGCAEREIEEETGVKDLTLKRKVGETYHVYREGEKDVLKISHWFYFTAASEQTMIPQEAEDITEVKWIPTQKIKEPMDNTYKNIREIMSKFFDEP